MMKESDPAIADVWRGHEYRDGSEECKQDYSMAAKFYGKAAQAGNAEGMYNLALLTKRGKGVKQDFRAALALLENAASQPPTRMLLGKSSPNVGVAEAEHSLGLNY